MQTDIDYAIELIYVEGGSFLMGSGEEEPEAEDWENFFLVAAAALDFDVTEDLSFRTSVNSIYDNTPAAGNKKNDLLLSAGVAVRF
jgi:hypothetical protein